MGWIWLAAPAAIAAFGIMLLVFTLGHLFRGDMGRAGSGLVFGLIFTCLGLVGSLIAWNTQTYARLTHEGPVAHVTVKAVDTAKNVYDVTIRRVDGVARTDICRLQGDEWLVGARVQKWKPWANVMGLDTTYDLDQVTNKYFTAKRGNGERITACDLSGSPPPVNKYVPSPFLAWLLGKSYSEDRHFGSANYMPLADGAEYDVVITQSGLNATPANDAALKANSAAP